MLKRKLMTLGFVSVLTISAMSIPVYAQEDDKQTETSTEVKRRKKHHAKKEKLVEPDNAIGKDAAKQNALKDAGISLQDVNKIKSRLTQNEDGTYIYKITFVYNNQKYSYKISAIDGTVLDKSNIELDNQANKKHHQKAKKQEASNQELTAY